MESISPTIFTIQSVHQIAYCKGPVLVDSVGHGFEPQGPPSKKKKNLAAGATCFGFYNRTVVGQSAGISRSLARAPDNLFPSFHPSPNPSQLHKVWLHHTN